MTEEQRIHIYLVDDEPSVLFALRLLLETLNFKVSDFAQPSDALVALAERGAECDLFLCDLRMPRMPGTEVLTAALKIRPEINFILMSAHATQREVQDALRAGAKGFLAKPFSVDQLKSTIAKLAA